MSRSLNLRGCGIFSDRVTRNRAVGGLGPFHVVQGNGPAGDARRIEVKRPSHPCGRTGPFFGRRLIRLGLKIRRLLRCPAKVGVLELAKQLGNVLTDTPGHSNYINNGAVPVLSNSHDAIVTSLGAGRSYFDPVTRYLA